MQCTSEKWLWIELIGFELNAPDFGVKAYLDRLGFTPDGLSLLIATPEFINTHTDDFLNKELPPEYCSYEAHNSNGERQREKWTGKYLKLLVDELHKYDIKVYFCIFEFCKEKEWLKEHDELFYVLNSEEKTSRSICPLKRLSDGSYYEDFFAAQLEKVMIDYNFDGYHAGDGFAHPRYPLYTGDFSDDMIEQFVNWSGINIPNNKPIEWILENQISKWRDFYIWRNTRFWEKIVKVLNKLNKDIIFNSAWTREPFEAIYRYGIDYKALYDIGIKKIIVEIADAGLELCNEGSQKPRPLYSRMAMSMLLRAYVPDAKLIIMNQIRDFNERYFILHHAPPLFELQVITHFNLFYRSADNKLKSCYDGVLACLADGLTRSEWEKINSTWNTGSSFKPESLNCAVVLYSEKQIEKQIKLYEKERNWYDYRILTRLLDAGAPIYAIANLDSLKERNEVLIVLNPELFEKNELQAIAAYKVAPVIGIGNSGCKLLNKPQVKTPQIKINKKIPTDIKDSWTWLDDLYVTDINDEFFIECAEFIRQSIVDTSFTPDNPAVKFVVEKLNETYRLILWNDEYFYQSIKISTDIKYKELKYISGFTDCEIPVINNSFIIKLPPRGVSIIQINTCLSRT
ncbi:MAG: hypothetical protein WCS73_01945 [Lentisphaeria bacterium]